MQTDNYKIIHSTSFADYTNRGGKINNDIDYFQARKKITHCRTRKEPDCQSCRYFIECR